MRNEGGRYGTQTLQKKRKTQIATDLIDGHGYDFIARKLTRTEKAIALYCSKHNMHLKKAKNLRDLVRQGIFTREKAIQMLMNGNPVKREKPKSPPIAIKKLDGPSYPGEVIVEGGRLWAWGRTARNAVKKGNSISKNPLWFLSGAICGFVVCATIYATFPPACAQVGPPMTNAEYLGKRPTAADLCGEPGCLNNIAPAAGGSPVEPGGYDADGNPVDKMVNCSSVMMHRIRQTGDVIRTCVVE